MCPGAVKNPIISWWRKCGVSRCWTSAAVETKSGDLRGRGVARALSGLWGCCSNGLTSGADVSTAPSCSSRLISVRTSPRTAVPTSSVQACRTVILEARQELLAARHSSELAAPPAAAAAAAGGGGGASAEEAQAAAGSAARGAAGGAAVAEWAEALESDLRTLYGIVNARIDRLTAAVLHVSLGGRVVRGLTRALRF